MKTHVAEKPFRCRCFLEVVDDVLLIGEFRAEFVLKVARGEIQGLEDTVAPHKLSNMKLSANVALAFAHSALTNTHYPGYKSHTSPIGSISAVAKCCPHRTKPHLTSTLIKTIFVPGANA